MNKEKKRPVIVNLAILTVITVIVWIGFEVYRVLTVKPESSVPAEILAPVNPDLDLQTLEKLQKRLYIDEAEIGEIPIVSPITGQSIPETPPAQATEEGTINE